MKLSADAGELLEDPTMHKCIAGSLIYITITKLDLSYAVGLVSQFMQAPRKPHLDAARRILKYVASHTLLPIAKTRSTHMSPDVNIHKKLIKLTKFDYLVKMLF